MAKVSPLPPTSAWSWNLGILVYIRGCRCGCLVTCAFTNTLQKVNLLVKGEITIPEVMITSCLMEAVFKWAKQRCHIRKLAANFEVFAVIVCCEIITEFVAASSRSTLYKLFAVKWPDIIGNAPSHTSIIPQDEEYDRSLRSNIPKEISLVSSLLQ